MDDALEHVGPGLTNGTILVQSTAPEEQHHIDANPGLIAIGNVDYEARVIFFIDAPLSEDVCRRLKFDVQCFV